MSDAETGNTKMSIGYGHVTALSHLIKFQEQDERVALLLGRFRAETWALSRVLAFIALINLRGTCLLYTGIWQRVEFYPVQSCRKGLPFF